MSINSEKMTVIGAGLVGSLLSTVLAKLGFEVDVFERRVDMRKESISAGRSINLAMSVRGLYALKKLGISEQVMSKAIPMPGRIIHPVSGPTVFQRYGKDDSECIYSIPRGDLNKILMSVAESTGKVKIHFQEKLVKANLGSSVELVFLNERTQEEKNHSPHKVFGTDGSASVLRHTLTSECGHEESESLLSHGYKELSMAPNADGSFKMEKGGLHIWPRGSYMLISLPNHDGSFTCTLFLSNQGILSFESLTTPEKVQQFFNEQFPDVVPLIPDLSDQFFKNPTGQMVTVKCAPWNHLGECVLLGDAAHAIVPFFGQGMNCGFEDVSVLWDMLQGAKERFRSIPWEKIFSDFSQLRKPNADAIADLAVENFVEMRDKVGDPKFLLAKQVEQLLEKEFPGDYISRYRLVSFSRVPYSTTVEVGKIEQTILSKICEGITEAKNVDLNLAKSLIQDKLAPLLRQVSKEGLL